MSKIKIKNFGPIKEGLLEDDGWLDIKKVTVFIGNQGSGKSTIAKVISTMSWLEKAINRGLNPKIFVGHVFNNLFNYHRLVNYFTKDTEIVYHGNAYSIELSPKSTQVNIIKKESHAYLVPKIMYVPAERNFLATTQYAFDVKGLPMSLQTFAEELRNAQYDFQNKMIELPIGNFKYEFDSGSSFIHGADHKLNLLEASSGFHSLVPLFLVSKKLSDSINEEDRLSRANLSPEQGIRRNQEIATLMADKTIPEEKKEKLLEVIYSKYHNKCFINIVEEPEQNLYPTSQWEILKSLLEFNNKSEGNKLIMTTHSPYLINYLTLAVKASILQNSLKTEEQKSKLNRIVPLVSTVKPEDIAIYELDETDGSIKKLPQNEGLPTDKNALNKLLGQGNELFDALLEIEEDSWA